MTLLMEEKPMVAYEMKIRKMLMPVEVDLVMS
jgi:hypothetical protein